MNKLVCGEGMGTDGAFNVLDLGQTEVHGDRYINLRIGSVSCKDPFHGIINL